MNAYDVAGFVTGLICVGLLVRNSVWNFAWGIVNALVFLASFWTAGLFADSALQIVYVVLNGYGWWAWLHAGRAATPLPISRLTRRGALLGALALVVMAAAFATVLAGALHSTVPVWDGTTTALSLVAQALQTRRIVETWWFWITADLIYVPLYVAKGLPLTAALYAIFLALCVAGLIAWRRELRAVASA